MYHSVAAASSPAFRRYTVGPEEFAAQVGTLSRLGYRTVTVAELVRLRRLGLVPPRTVALTFDDGYADFHSAALPVLRSHGFTATVYIATGFTGATSAGLDDFDDGGRRMLSWSQLAELASEGVECAAHTVTHPELTSLPARRIADELRASRAELEDRLGLPVSTLAYPFGFHDRRVRAAAAAAGYAAACAVDDLAGDASDNPFALPRLTVTPGLGTTGFAELLDRGRQGARSVAARRRVWQAWRRHGPRNANLDRWLLRRRGEASP